MLKIGALEFQNVFWLWFTIGVIVLCIYFWCVNKLKKNATIQFSQIETAKSIFGIGNKSKRYKSLFCCTFGAIVLITLGLANPFMILNETNSEVSVVFSIDASFTMDNLEGNISRIEIATELSNNIINNLDKNNLVGIMDFGSSQFYESCLTTNHGDLIRKLDKITPRKELTLIGDGLLAATELVDSIPKKNKRIVLLSDGINSQRGISQEESNKLIKYVMSKNIRVLSVGIGSDLIEVYDGYEDGRANSPRYIQLNKEFLKQVADETGGKYFEYHESNLPEKIKQQIYKDVISDKNKQSLKDFFFIGALLLLLISVFFRFGSKMIIQ